MRKPAAQRSCSAAQHHPQPSPCLAFAPLPLVNLLPWMSLSTWTTTSDPHASLPSLLFFLLPRSLPTHSKTDEAGAHGHRGRASSPRPPIKPAALALGFLLLPLFPSAPPPQVRGTHAPASPPPGAMAGSGTTSPPAYPSAVASPPSSSRSRTLPRTHSDDEPRPRIANPATFPSFSSPPASRIASSPSSELSPVASGACPSNSPCIFVS